MSVQQVLLVEDNQHTRNYLKKVIASHACFDVRDVSTCREAKAVLQAKVPDFLVLDLGLPDGNGLTLIAPALQANPEMLILVLTVFGEDASVINAIRAGAKGYLLKDRALEEIGEVLVSMREGYSPIDHRVARALLQLVAGESDGTQTHRFKLSRSEKKILALIVQGMSYKAIAYEAGISINTVREHIRRIYKKLEVHSRSQAVHCINAHNISFD